MAAYGFGGRQDERGIFGELMHVLIMLARDIRISVKVLEEMDDFGRNV